VIVAGLPWIVFKAVVYFWAAGPQLVICLWLAYATCRRRRGDMLDWLIGGFAAALLPIAGVVVMIVLFRRAGRDRRGASGAGDRAASPADPPVAGAGTR
jgi:hypothetical protein